MRPVCSVVETEETQLLWRRKIEKNKQTVEKRGGKECLEANPWRNTRNAGTRREGNVKFAKDNKRKKRTEERAKAKMQRDEIVVTTDRKGGNSEGVENQTQERRGGEGSGFEEQTATLMKWERTTQWATIARQ
ncbi:uncharacterized protein SPSK_03707 [Sporothrix schenckii 1099-18]|uniref:Uncharacterized protein n=1 Tax=Sporothrix schenckii 1099-18 TaxID=1397361 RepID=A0A0F2M0Y7_SPOSC|nr:uncharacterized protein SPSK_03707 [Sporothrix schenckii 1099-18]KJR82744.1 hypothetical protein SPSK_03707 [Sporothrix schenckii 1099-18]